VTLYLNILKINILLTGCFDFVGFILQLLALETRIKERNADLLSGSDPLAVARFSDWTVQYITGTYLNNNGSVNSAVDDDSVTAGSTSPGKNVNVLIEYPVDEVTLINCFLNSRPSILAESQDPETADVPPRVKKTRMPREVPLKVTFVDPETLASDPLTRNGQKTELAPVGVPEKVAASRRPKVSIYSGHNNSFRVKSPSPMPYLNTSSILGGSVGASSEILASSPLAASGIVSPATSSKAPSVGIRAVSNLLHTGSTDQESPISVDGSILTPPLRAKKKKSISGDNPMMVVRSQSPQAQSPLNEVLFSDRRQLLGPVSRKSPGNKAVSSRQPKASAAQPFCTSTVDSDASPTVGPVSQLVPAGYSIPPPSPAVRAQQARLYSGGSAFGFSETATATVTPPSGGSTPRRL
jgi:hypothetical protein